MSESGPAHLSSSRIPLVGGPPSGKTPGENRPPDAADRRVASADLGPAFELASAELGFAAAAWLFIDTLGSAGGPEAVRHMGEELGTSFTVLDLLVRRYLEGARRPPISTTRVRETLAGVRRVLVVGLEADHLDALARDLPADVRIGLVTYRLQRVDWPRVLANFGGRVEPVDLAEFQGWAGARSSIVTFVYGEREGRVNVLSAFLRIAGPDVRTQFRDIVGWDVLGAAPDVYPRYLVETAATELTSIVPYADDAADED